MTELEVVAAITDEIGDELKSIGHAVLYFTVCETEAEAKMAQGYILEGTGLTQEERDLHQAWCAAIVNGASKEGFEDLGTLMSRLRGTFVIDWEEDSVTFDLDALPAKIVKIVCNAAEISSIGFAENDDDEVGEEREMRPEAVASMMQLIRDGSPCNECEHRDTCRCESEPEPKTLN